MSPTPCATFLMAFLLLALGGCSDPPAAATRVKSDHTWSDEQEVIYQLREVIRYEDERQRLRQNALQRLSLPVGATTPTETAVATGEGQDQQQQ